MDVIKGKRIVEWFKTALIVLLAASAPLLGWRTGLFNDFFSAIPLFNNVAGMMRGTSSAGTAESGIGVIKEAAQPLTIVITGEDGGRYGVRYDTVSRNAVYSRTSSILGEALGSASSSQEIIEEKWREALSGAGIYFEYIEPVKLSILSGWLGTRLPDMVMNAPVRRVFIAFGEERSRIYYQNTDSGLFYGADTASPAGKVQELDIYSANGAQFAYETGIGVADNAPYVIILPGNEHPDIRAAASGGAEELLDLVIDAMGHRNETNTQYYDNDGALVRVGTQFSARADTLGRVVYRRTDVLQQNSGEQALSENEIIERARVIASDTLGNTDSSAEVFFESLEYDPGGSLSVYFGYYIAGGRIHLHEDGFAARVIFTGGAVSRLELNFRSFALSGEFTKLMPEKQTLASAGGEFVLSYSDTGAERLQPAWTHY